MQVCAAANRWGMIDGRRLDFDSCHAPGESQIRFYGETREVGSLSCILSAISRQFHPNGLSSD